MKKPQKTVLCAVDFSPASEAAMHYAAVMHCRDTELVMLHVAPEVDRNSGVEGLHLHEFSRCSDILAQHSVQALFTLRHGDPAEGILGYARELDADMIVIGSHGQSAISRLLVGGTAEKVMRHAPCPVVILKTQVVTQKAAGIDILQDINK